MVKFCIPKCLGGGDDCLRCHGTKSASAVSQFVPEASVAVKARAVKDYFNAFDPQSLPFKEGDLITVLEQRGDGQWKGCVSQDGRMTTTGFFPANHVVLIDEQVVKEHQSKTHPVPDLLDRGPCHRYNGHLQPNGLIHGSDASSLSSCSMDDSSYHPPSPHVPNALGPPPIYTPYGAPPPSPGGPASHGMSHSAGGGGGGGLHSSQGEPAGPEFHGIHRETPRGPALQAFPSVCHSPVLKTFQTPPASPSLKSFQGDSLSSFHFAAPPSPRLTSFQGSPHGGGLSLVHGGSPHGSGGRSYGSAPSSPSIHVTAPPSYSAALGGSSAPPPPSTPPPPASAAPHLITHPAFTQLQEIPEGSVSNHSTPTRSSQHSQAVTKAAPSGAVAAAAAAAVVVGSGEAQHAEDWAGPSVACNSAAGRDMKAHSAATCKEYAQQQQQQQQANHHQHHHSPVHGKRNSSGSSDSGRGHLEPKVVTVTGQTSQETGVSSSSTCRQSYHSTSSSSVGSLDRLEDPAPTSTINVHQLLQAGVPDKEVLHAWLHDLHFEEYYAHFLQAGYDMPTISRMTPEDLTAIGITKPAHRKRLKAEIARLHIHDGIPDFCPHDLMEWLHMLGLGMYHETLAGQGYNDMDYVTDITWEDLEEIGIKKLGHQKKIMLAIDRLKRLTSTSKRLSSLEPQRSSIEMLEPPPPAPPIGRWSGEISALPPHMYEGGLGMGAKPKKSPSGDSISTTGSAGSGSNSSQGSGDVRAMPIPIPVPREDVGLAGGVPYSRQNSAPSSAPGNYSDLLTPQVKRQGRASATEDLVRDMAGQSVYQPFHQSPSGSMGCHVEYSSSHPMCTSDPGTGMQMAPKVHPKPTAKVIVAKTRRTSRDYSPDAEMEKHESENNSDGNKATPVIPVGNVAAVAAMMERTGEVYTGGTMKRGAGGHLRGDIREHIYDQPQVPSSPAKAPASPKPQVMPKPASPLHVATQHAPAAPSSGSPPGRSKKAPPPPPKRTHSIRNDTVTTVVNKVEPAASPAMTTARSQHVTTSSPDTSNSNNNTTKIGNHSKTLPANVHISPVPASSQSRQDPATADKAQPQTEAFASCVKSLSERFGSKKHSGEGSRDSVASEGEDFPPPPPPIAMDLITPKIHNYGIPSRADMHHGPPHVRDYSHHHQHHHQGREHPGGLPNQIKPSHASDTSSARPEQPSLTTSESPVRRISPGRDVPASSGVALEKAKDADVHIVPSNLGERRSESTTSFESTTSSSSADSNTLPFANENVGTIKQRAANIKPSIVQAFETGDGQRSVDLNTSIFEHSFRDNHVSQENRTTPSGARTEGQAAAGTGAHPPQATNSQGAVHHRRDSGGGLGGTLTRKTIFPIPGSKHVAPGMPQGQKMASAVSRLAATAPHITRMAQQNQQSQQNQQNQSPASEAPAKPPVPSKKPVMPISPHTHQRSHHAGQPQSPQHHQQPPPHPHPQPQQQQQRQQVEQPHAPHHHHHHQPQPHEQQQQQQQPQGQSQTSVEQSGTGSERRASVSSVPADNAEKGPAARQTCDVLSDIDDMLQGLTDELDAMLEETKG